MPLRRGGGDVAGDLRRGYLFGQVRERYRRIVAGLWRTGRPSDCPAVQPWRRAGFQPPNLETEAGDGVGQGDRRGLTHTAGRPGFRAQMNLATQKCAGGNHQGWRRKRLPIGQGHPGDPPIVADDHVGDRARHQAESVGGGQQLSHGRPVQRAVGLRPRPLDRRSLAAVENPKLNPGAVDGPRHQAIQGVDLAHQMALTQAADGRVARHLAQCCQILRDQRGPSAKARGGGGGLGTGVPPTHDNHFIISHRALLTRRRRP